MFTLLIALLMTISQRQLAVYSAPWSNRCPADAIDTLGLKMHSPDGRDRKHTMTCKKYVTTFIEPTNGNTAQVCDSDTASCESLAFLCLLCVGEVSQP